MRKVSSINKTISKGSRVLSDAEIYELNKMSWEQGVSQVDLRRHFKTSVTVIYRYLDQTYDDYLKRKTKHEGVL